MQITAPNGSFKHLVKLRRGLSYELEHLEAEIRDMETLKKAARKAGRERLALAHRNEIVRLRNKQGKISRKIDFLSRKISNQSKTHKREKKRMGALRRRSRP